MQVRLYWKLTSLCVACALCSPLWGAEVEPNLLDMDLATLMTLKISPSADASAEGLFPSYPGGQVAKGGRVGVLGAQALMDSPFSVISYTHDFIQSQQAASVGDVLQYDPGVRITRGFDNFQQVYMLRGLPVFSDDMTYNGLYGILPRQYLATEMVERIEVLRGANAFLNSAAPSISGLGGTIDVIPKRAPKTDLAEISLSSDNLAQQKITADIAKRSQDGTLGARLNLVDSSGDTALEDERRQLKLASLGLDYQGAQLRVSADLGYQYRRLDGSQPNITFADDLAVTPAPDADRSLAQPWTFANERDLFGTLRAEYDLSPNGTAWLAFGERKGNEKSSLAAFITINDEAGNYTASRFDVVHQDSVDTGEAGIKWTLEAAGLKHQLLISANQFENSARNAYAIYNSISDNLYQPTSPAEPTQWLFGGGDLHQPLITTLNRTRSLALADSIATDSGKLRLTLGLRQQNIREVDYDYNTGAQTAIYDQSRLTPLVGLVIKLTPEYSLYANSLDGLLKGDTAPTANSTGAVANAGQSLKPYQTHQHELGLKYDSGSLGATVSVFELLKPITGYTPDNYFAVIDHQRHRGLEISTYGELRPNLRLLAGATWLNTDIQGKHAIGAPSNQANLGIEWQATPQLAVNTQLIHTGAEYTNLTNSQQIPSWDRIDLGASYQTNLWGNPVNWRAQIRNLTNHNYWASAGGFPGASYLSLGEPRSLLLSATLNF